MRLSYTKTGIKISVRIADALNHQIIDHANPDQTGSPIIINAPIIAVADVKNIGFNLVFADITSASINQIPLCCSSSKYSSNIIEFHIEIHANAITHIIDVALKYSFDVRYKILYHGRIHRNQKRKGNMIIHHIPNQLNLIDTIKYNTNRVNHRANHKSLNVSILNSRSPPNDIVYGVFVPISRNVMSYILRFITSKRPSQKESFVAFDRNDIIGYMTELLPISPYKYVVGFPSSK